MTRDAPVKGLAELDKYLSALPMNLQRGAYRAGLTAAAAVVRDEARLRVPKKTGKLARSIRTGSARQNQDGTFSIRVGLYGPQGYIGRFIEYGVAGHFISAGNSGLSARKLTQKLGREGSSESGGGAMKIGDKWVSGTVFHPGFPAKPFLRPALDIRADEAVAAFAVRIRAYLEGKTGFITPLDEAA